MPDFWVSDSAVLIGPSWDKTYESGPTLAWQIAEWCYEHLEQPDGPKAGQPWEFTDEQFRWLCAWYAVDHNGRWRYRRGSLIRQKGWGKDPLAAVLCCIEFFGPCRFSHWDDEGEPVAKPHPAPWVQIAATSKDQTVNTSALLPGLIPATTISKYSLNLGKEISYSATGRLQCVTSSPRSLEGARPSFIVAGEVQHWLENNEGHAMMKVIRRNLAKSGAGTARLLSISNPFCPGENSVGEQDHEAYQAVLDGRSKMDDFLYDWLGAPEGHSLADRTWLRAALIDCRGDSVWVDVDRLIDEIMDPTTLPADARRFYLCQITAAEDSWIRPDQWGYCDGRDNDQSDLIQLEPGDAICLGFDGSIRDDATGLVACRLLDGLIVPLGVWEKPSGPGQDEWSVPRSEVDALIHEVMAKYAVVGLYADPPHWQDYVDAWTQRYGARMLQPAIHGKPFEWWTHRPLAMVHALERFYEAVASKELTHNGDPVLRRHILNAKRRTGTVGITIAKEHPKSRRKIDLAMAATLAWECRSDAIAHRLQERFQRAGNRRRRSVGV